MENETIRWTIPGDGEPGQPLPGWLETAIEDGVVLKVRDGSAMVPGATSISCMANAGDTLVLVRRGFVDIEHSLTARIDRC